MSKERLALPDRVDGNSPAAPPPPAGAAVLGESFPRELRILRGADFRRILGRGWKWTTAHLVVHATPNELGVSRFGLTVSRKVGNAVVRNRVRRRLKEGFRRRFRQAVGTPCIDLVLRALPGAGSIPASELEAEVLAALDARKRGLSQRRKGRPPKEG